MAASPPFEGPLRARKSIKNPSTWDWAALKESGDDAFAWMRTGGRAMSSSIGKPLRVR